MRSLFQDLDLKISNSSLIELNSSFKSKSKNLISSIYDEDPIISKLIGYINPLGMFKLNLTHNKIYFLSSNRTKKLGFFDTLSFESSLKEWHQDISEAFIIHKKIIGESILQCKGKRMKTLQSRIVNWSYFDSIQVYTVENRDLNWYNTPIFT